MILVRWAMSPPVFWSWGVGGVAERKKKKKKKKER
jgi:hypothetical protein